MARKHRKPKSKSEKDRPQIQLVESDDPNGPWTPVEIEPAILDLDIARLDNPVLNEYVPVDHRTPLGNELLGFDREKIIHKRFGNNVKLAHIRDYMERMGRSKDGINWTDVVVVIEREKTELPKDLISLSVVVTEYETTKNTVRRAIKDEKINSYRLQQGKNARIYVSEAEVKREWPKKIR